MRAFIAVDLPPEIKADLSGLIRKLKRIAPPAISWAREEGMHVTLKFLGEIEEETAAGIGRAMTIVAGKAKGFAVAVRGAGMFPPPPRPPRVVWIGLEDSPPLMTLQAGLEAALETLGFPREQRPFHPHLTLGRIKAPGGLGAVLDAIRKTENVRWGEMNVGELVLFRSVLRPAGAEYTPIEKGRLGS